MKILMLLLALCSIEALELQVTEEFHSLNSQDSELNFIKKYSKNNIASIKGYVIALEMKQAEYSFNPFTKLKIYLNSKKKLDQLIDYNKSDVHLRYLRLMLQEKTPTFLGYDDFLKEDKEFLKGKLLEKDDSDYLDYYIRKNTSL